MTAELLLQTDISWEGPTEHLSVVEFSATEGLSKIPLIETMLISESANLPLADMLYKPASISLSVGDHLTERRSFSGIITRLEHKRTGHNHIKTSSTKTYFYEAVIQPEVWKLTKMFRSYVHKKKSAPEIIKETLTEAGVKQRWQLCGTYRTREYTLQFQESHFHFISRLMEDEGIYFYNDHENGAVVFCDAPGCHLPCRPYEDASYSEGLRDLFQQRKLECVSSLSYEMAAVSGGFEVHDYNDTKAKTNLSQKDKLTQSPGFSELEVYTHNMSHLDRGQGKTYARLLKEEAHASAKRIQAESNCRSFSPGFVFNLKHHYCEELNKKWLLIDTRVTAHQNTYHCFFTATPADVVYRPPRVTQQTKVDGLQTAVITGPPGSEVYLDDLGRCKLQFHWDREGEKNDRSSMWVRVSNNYAGKDYGIQWIPRIGNEVLVQFINGNPDLPVVVGRVFNDSNACPLKPANKWQNIIKTIKDNHILFDDQDGKEMLDIRAQKDMTTLVMNNADTTVENNRTVTVKNNQTHMVKNNQSLTVENNRTVTVNHDKTLTVANNYRLTVKGDQTHDVGGKRTVSVTGNDRLNVSGDRSAAISGNHDVTVMGDQNVSVTQNAGLDAMTGKISLSAHAGGIDLTSGAASLSMTPASLTLAVGPNAISIDPAMITINGMMIKLN
ncbi:type VI secretion system Vgr family protein [Acanthopleuribacter pedis]|uniref:Type VI secretion system tip protein VgrG n=1 Tax=Acanthopleuribacter pedis TaxID=442870 RepID=A0A8J7QHF6_9BACT|nr:type VI secretion system tip protein TssI/VgrG [Acanthopleuribacter pedis]MBO1322515.1 type VI secretion system tip protein VgrG [Acanthopleuribacter pedis]